MEKDFYVYMMAKKPYGTIYKGMSSDIISRAWQHKNNCGSQFTKKYDVKKLVWYRHCGNWEEAVKWEKRLRRYSRQWKINLIEEKNPEWRDLYPEITGAMDCTYLSNAKTCNDGVSLRDISKKLNSSLEARMLVRHVTGLSDADLIGADTLSLSAEQESQLNDFIAQRLQGRPVSKIIGVKEFYGRDFTVTDDVLDPRPDSEILIEIILRHCERKNNTSPPSSPDLIGGAKDPLVKPKDDTIRILDLGTGSGCLILTLLSEFPNATGVATDISDKAISIAMKNAQKLGVDTRIQFIKSDWFESINGEFDVVLSNPPYINSDVVPTLDENVRDYDPVLALDGGEDGLNPYKVILPQIRPYLKKGGIMAFEHGYDQQSRIKRLIADAGFDDIQGFQDLGGQDRVVTAIHK